MFGGTRIRMVRLMNLLVFVIWFEIQSLNFSSSPESWGGQEAISVEK